MHLCWLAQKFCGRIQITYSTSLLLRWMEINDNGCLFPGNIDSMGVPMCQIIIYLLTKMWTHFWLRGALWWMQGDQSLFSTQTVKAFCCLLYCLMNGFFYTMSVGDEKTRSEVLHKCSVLYQCFSASCLERTAIALTLSLKRIATRIQVRVWLMPLLHYGPIEGPQLQ